MRIKDLVTGAARPVGFTLALFFLVLAIFANMDHDDGYRAGLRWQRHGRSRTKLSTQSAYRSKKWIFTCW
jgi:hypothetical protein